MHAHLLTGFVAADPNPPPKKRRHQWAHQYAQNDRYDPLYSHPRDVLEETPWEENIAMLTVEEMKDHSLILQGELDSSNICFGTQ